MYYIICYDITENRIRAKVSKLLEGYGVRVQKSVFECSNLTEKQLLRLMDIIDRFIDHTSDNVRFYRQCKSCLKNFDMVGPGFKPERALSAYY